MTRMLGMLVVSSAMVFGQPTPPPPPAPPPPAPDVRVLTSHDGSFLGVGTAEIDAERAKELKLPAARGVEITRVVPDSPAEKAGLKEHDVVLEYNGERVEGTEQFQRLVRETPVGRQVKLTISRSGATQTVAATIGQTRMFNYGSSNWQTYLSPDFQQRMERLQQQLGNLRMRDMPTPMMAWRTGVLGIEAESLTSQLADFFGVKEGVLVRSVTRDSAAEKAGMKAGDVITKVDNQPVNTPGEISSQIRSLQSKKTFPVTVVRNHQEMTLNVTLEDQQRQVGPQRLRAPRAIRPFRGTVISAPAEPLL